MIGLIKGMFKILHYVILNSIVGLFLSLVAYVVTGSVKFSVLVFVMIFVAGLFVEWKGRFYGVKIKKRSPAWLLEKK